VRNRFSLLLLLLVGACSKTEPTPDARKDPTPSSSESSAPPPTPLVLARGIRSVKVSAGDDASGPIRGERDRAQKNGREVVVYVGAKWCEPCQRFHAAVERGDLDADFPNLTLLEFDADADREGLATAGYVSELIPLFVVPEANGRASNKRIEGSVKGDRAVSNIAPRLRQILAR
jgi:thiol-disulfide isomerase/thioredoxin